MLDDLKQSIQENKNHETPLMSNWWALIADIEKLVPPAMLHDKWKGYVKKAARILFCRFVCKDDTITSFKDMEAGQLWLIHKWLNHDENGIVNCIAVTNWMAENQLEIYGYAATDVKPVKLAKDKARRDVKKQAKEMPF